jgi:uncharacterized protein YkwD
MSITHRAGPRSRLAGGVGALALLLVAAFAAVPAVSAAAATTPGSTTMYEATGGAPVLTLAPLSTAAQYEADVLAATNAQRVSHGLRAMTVTSCLSSLATSWATHLAATNTLTHQSLTPFLTNCHAMAAAENIAKGNVTASDVVTLWMNSPDHRANLLNGTYPHVAIGAAKLGSTWFVVQDFSG